jgi:hypothetical protein
LQEPLADHGELALHWWLYARKMVPKPFRQGLDSLVFLIGWMLWKEWNARTFGVVATATPFLVVAMQQEASLWASTGNKHLQVLLSRLQASSGWQHYLVPTSSCKSLYHVIVGWSSSRVREGNLCVARL